MDVVERNVSVYMIRDSLDNIPNYPLPPGYLTRWYQPGDEQLWVDVQSRAEGYLEITHKLFVEQFGSDPRPLAERQCFLCDARGGAIGTATAWFDDDYCGQPYGQLHWVAIVPEAQGQGLAKPLLSIVLNRMAELGHARCYLGTSTARLPAVNLYCKFGFVPHVRNVGDLAVWREMRPWVKVPFELADRGVGMCIIASGKRVILRDRLPSDVESYLHWKTHGEWRLYDAPWENEHVPKTAEEEEAFRERFLEKCRQELPAPRRRATIATLEGKPLGWVNRYGDKRFSEACRVGVDICEDAYLSQGVGTEALGLWVDYLFSNSGVHRIGLDTWSFNGRMMRVAEKLGFVREGAERELIQWQGKWLDRVHFGMLREEWKAL